MLKKSFSTVFALAIITLFAFSSNAQIPQLINYQGMLTDATDNPINGSRVIQFRIYNSASGGTALWTETQTVAVNNGLFNVLLGSITPIPFSVFDGGDKYLALKVGSDAEMTPRKRLVSVGYAYTATGVFGSSNVFPSDGNVGIGTASPSTKLEVAGNGRFIGSTSGNVSIWQSDKAITIRQDGTDSFISNKQNFVGNGAASNGWLVLNGSNGVLLNYGDEGSTGTVGVTLNPSGNVGIGTTEPVKKLHVMGHIFTQASPPLHYFKDTGQTLPAGMWRLGFSNNTMLIDENTAAEGGFVTYSRHMVIKSGGNVGIGITNPDARLDVNGWIKGRSGLRIRPSTAGDNIIFENGAGLAKWVAYLSNSETDFAIHESGFGNRVTVKAGGNVGIGTTTPEGKLAINTRSMDDTRGLYINGGGDAEDEYVAYFLGRSSSFPSTVLRLASNRYGNPAYKFIEAISDEDGTPVTQFVVHGDGKVGIGMSNPTNILTVQRNSATDPVADAWRTYSSRRWKTNIRTISEALDKVQRLRGVYYDWKADGKHDIGLIAEEVGEVIPEVVTYEENNKDANSIEYARLVALLIEAVKELKVENNQLRAENQALQQSNKTLKTRISALEKTTAQLTASMEKLEVLLAAEINNNSQKNNKLAYLREK